jgi:hypothetical protein
MVNTRIRLSILHGGSRYLVLGETTVFDPVTGLVALETPVVGGDLAYLRCTSDTSITANTPCAVDILFPFLKYSKCHKNNH